MFENPLVRDHQRKRDEVPKDFHKQVFLLIYFVFLFILGIFKLFKFDKASLILINNF